MWGGIVRPRPSSRKALSGLGRLLRGRGAFAGLLNSFWFGMTGFTVGDLHVAQLARGGKAQRVSHDFVRRLRSEEHTSELQSLMRISYAVFCLKKKKSEIIIQLT